jgi:hypothetical protein
MFADINLFDEGGPIEWTLEKYTNEEAYKNVEEAPEPENFSTWFAALKAAYPDITYGHVGVVVFPDPLIHVEVDTEQGVIDYLWYTDPKDASQAVEKTLTEVFGLPAGHPYDNVQKAAAIAPSSQTHQ